MATSRLQTISLLSTCLVFAFTSYSAFSRFTHGQYTPAFYAYQLDRAPDTDATAYVPFVDAAVALQLLVPSSRPYAAVFWTLSLAFGVVVRLQAGKDALSDAALCLAAAVAAWSSLSVQK